MNTLESFYNRYHAKNAFFFKTIDASNCTYFYILQLLQQADALTGATVLDLGCGVGAVSFFMAQHGAKAVIGLDVSSRAIGIAQAAQQQVQQPNLIFKCGELVTKMHGFDTIFCSEVIEHVKDDAHFLDVIHSNLKVGGTLILTTPSKENVLFKLGFYRSFDSEVGHYRRYTKESLQQLLKAHGFDVKSIRAVEGPLRNILYTTKLGFLIRFIRGPLVPVFHFFDSISAQLFGASDIQVIAKKI